MKPSILCQLNLIQHAGICIQYRESIYHLICILERHQILMILEDKSR